MAQTLEQKLCRRSFGYAFVRNVFARPLLYVFYRKVDIIGAKTVPDEGPIIFTPNHQNALMDALSILCTKDRQPVFMARADIFQKPFIIKTLHFLRILPVYRKRDGGSSSDNNRETFDMILKVLHHRQAVGIMPEGTHNEVKHLRVLQKGVFRLAMQAQEVYGKCPAVKIVPVGLEYSSTNKFRSNLIVNYGKAIDVSDFYDLYVENPARAFKLMQDTLSEKMKEGMINIEEETHYRAIERIRVFYPENAARRLGLNFRKAEDRLHAQQKTIAALQQFIRTDPEVGAILCTQINEYNAGIEEHHFTDRTVERQPYSFFGLTVQTMIALLGIPFWLAGLAFNYIPYKVSDVFSRKVKDPQFVSSVQFVIGLVLYPIYHAIVIALLIIFVPCVWGKVVMSLLTVPLGIFVFEYFRYLKSLASRWRFWNGKRRKNTAVWQLIELRKSIFEKMDMILRSPAGDR